MQVECSLSLGGLQTLPSGDQDPYESSKDQQQHDERPYGTIYHWASRIHTAHLTIISLAFGAEEPPDPRPGHQPLCRRSGEGQCDAVTGGLLHRRFYGDVSLYLNGVLVAFGVGRCQQFGDSTANVSYTV